MPLYTYYCDHCDRKFELSSSISERDSERNCSLCDTPLVRTIDRPGMVWSPTSSGGGHKV